MKLLDCTLRDGANVAGTGLSRELTCMVIEGLIDSNIKIIEYANAYGVGSNKQPAPLSDIEYLEAAVPYMDKAELGMFLSAGNSNPDTFRQLADGGLKFIRVGINAGDADKALQSIEWVKQSGMKVRYAMMKGYVLTPDQAAKEVKLLASHGVDEITLMDSAGTMLPDEVENYISAMTAASDVDIGYHSHSNLGLSPANALAAVAAGAKTIDTCLMGMARSAGNLSTESAVAVFQRKGMLGGIDFLKLMRFLEYKLSDELRSIGYHAPIKPVDLVFGAAGCHSSFLEMFQSTAKQKNVDLFDLIMRTSAINRKNPTKELTESVAETILAS